MIATNREGWRVASGCRLPITYWLALLVSIPATFRSMLDRRRTRAPFGDLAIVEGRRPEVGGSVVARGPERRCPFLDQGSLTGQRLVDRMDCAGGGRQPRHGTTRPSRAVQPSPCTTWAVLKRYDVSV
jgi:hypothetical protein